MNHGHAIAASGSKHSSSNKEYYSLERRLAEEQVFRTGESNNDQASLTIVSKQRVRKVAVSSTPKRLRNISTSKKSKPSDNSRDSRPAPRRIFGKPAVTSVDNAKSTNGPPEKPSANDKPVRVHRSLNAMKPSKAHPKPPSDSLTLDMKEINQGVVYGAKGRGRKTLITDSEQVQSTLQPG